MAISELNIEDKGYRMEKWDGIIDWDEDALEYND